MYIALVVVRYSLEIQEQKKNPEKHNRGLGGHGNDTVKSVTSDILSWFLNIATRILYRA